MRLLIGLWIALLICFACPALAGQPAKGGNAALMEAWKARQQELSKKIAERLFEDGRIPRDGTVTYKARVKPDASAPGGLVLSVDALTVTPASPGAGNRVEGQAASQAMDMALGPRDPGIAVHMQSLDVPVGTEVTGKMTIKDGKPVEEPPSAPKAPPEPEQPPSLWQQLLNALGL
jgi:hypothetical protein